VSPRKKGIVDTGRLNGAEKAAIVLLSLGEEHVALWEQMDDE
jgi:flagellar motor switch protein FliG